MKIKPYQADILLIFVALSWGLTFALVKDAVEQTPVYTFLFWRFGSAFILMAMASYAYRSRLNISTLWAGILLGVLNFGAYAFQTFGLTLAASSAVAFITGLFVVMTPLLAWLFFHKKISKNVTAGVAVSMAGLWFLTGGKPLSMGLGELYSLVCALLFSLHLLFTDCFVKRYPVILLVSIQFATVALLSAVMGILHDGTLSADWNNSEFLIALVITVVFATIFAFWVQSSMQRFTTPTKAALIFTIEPLSAAVFGYYYLNESLSTVQIFGGLMIVTGVILAELRG